MSTMSNSPSASRACNTREPSWAEDFIDLSEFCQPSTIPTRMEDSADECITSPISSTVRNHGFDYTLDGNEGLDPSLEETLWYMPSPITIQEELCDPISDWLAATKETNNSDNLSASRNEISYNLDDTLLSPRLSSVPNPASQYNRESMAFCPDDSLTPPLQPDITFFHSNDQAAATYADHRRAAPIRDNLLPSEPPKDAVLRLPPADSLFNKEKRSTSPQPPPPLLPSVASSGVAATSAAATRLTSSHCGNRYPSSSSGSNQFLECVKTEVAAVLGPDATSSSNVSFPPRSVQTSASVAQSPSNLGDEIEAQSPTCSETRRTTTRLKMGPNRRLSANASSPIDAPEMLQPLVNKNAEFDLVSYVFEDNKPSLSFDLSNVRTNAQDAKKVSEAIAPSSQVTIKTEPKEEPCPLAEDGSESHHHPKRRRDSDDDDTVSNTNSKRSRRYSNCSNDDLTQLESEKYRELRNKNNEASRRSRANRKNREVEMREHAFKLEAENRRLKVKAEEMEKLVKRLRNCLMQLVLKRT